MLQGVDGSDTQRNDPNEESNEDGESNGCGSFPFPITGMASTSGSFGDNMCGEGKNNVQIVCS
jgi:hypothetical protein